MKKCIACSLAAIIAIPIFAEETSHADYGQATQTPTLELIWRFERESSGSVTYAVITGVAVTGGENPIGDISVPQSLVCLDNTSLVVKKIASGAFANQIGISSIFIPTTVQYIGPRTFSGCTILSSIEVDSGNPWFSSHNGILYDKDSEELIACPARTETITLPQSLKKIGEEAFADCFRLKTISIPSSVNTIGTNAFLRCTRLESITFDGNAPTTVGTTPFAETPAGMIVYVPQDDATFGNVPGIWNERETQYSESGDNGGNDETGGIETTNIDENGVVWSATVYNDRAELGAYGSTPVISPETSGNITVPREIIHNMRPYTVYNIPSGAFAGCSEITSINIPATITSIAKDAFNGCTSLVTFAVSPGNESYSSRNGILYSKDGKTLIKVPAKFSFAATFTERENSTKKDIVEIIGSTNPDTMTTKQNQIVELKSYGKVNSTTVTEFTPAVSAAAILSGVTAISDYAFTDCGLLPEGSTVTGTLVVNVDGQETERKTGTFQLPVGTDSTGWENYSYLSSQAGFYNGSVCLYHTALSGSKSVSYEVPFNIPVSVTNYNKIAFEGSHFTSIIKPGTLTSTPPVVSVNQQVNRHDDDSRNINNGFGVRPILRDTSGIESAIAEGEVIEAYVGVKLSIPLDVGNAPDGSLSTVSAKGLPSGVKLVKTAVKDGSRVVAYIYAIEGAPTRAQSAKTVVLKVTNKKNKLNGSFSFAIKVLAMPSWVSGKYNGVCFDGTTEIGSASATISSAGKLSGKIMVPSDDGKKSLKLSYTAKGFSAFDEESSSFSGVATMRINKQSVDIPFRLSAYDGAGQLILDLPGMTAMLEQDTWQHGEIVANSTIQVDGFTFKLAANGKVKWSGSVEDDNGRALSVSGSTQLLSGPSALVYIPPKANLVGGRCKLFQLK